MSENTPLQRVLGADQALSGGAWKSRLAQQALLRAARLEAGLFTTCLDQALGRDGEPIIPMTEDLAGNGDIEITRAQNRNFALGEGFHRMARNSNVWSLFLRYQAQAERHYRRAVEEFERLRALRQELPNKPIEEAQPEENKTDDAPRNEPVSTPKPPAAPGKVLKDVFVPAQSSG